MSQIPDIHKNAASICPGTERLDQNSINVAVNLELPRANGGGNIRRTIKLFSFSKLSDMLKRMFPDTAHQDFDWDWCSTRVLASIIDASATPSCDTDGPGTKLSPRRFRALIRNTTSGPLSTFAGPKRTRWKFRNWHKLGGGVLLPSREENRICQCLSNATMADFNAGLQAIIGGPDVPGQVLFNMTNHTHYFNRTHYDHWRIAPTARALHDGSETPNPRSGLQRTMSPHPTTTTTNSSFNPTST